VRPLPRSVLGRASSIIRQILCHFLRYFRQCRPNWPEAPYLVCWLEQHNRCAMGGGTAPIALALLAARKRSDSTTQPQQSKIRVGRDDVAKDAFVVCQSYRSTYSQEFAIACPNTQNPKQWLPITTRGPDSRGLSFHEEPAVSHSKTGVKSD